MKQTLSESCFCLRAYVRVQSTRTIEIGIQIFELCKQSFLTSNIHNLNFFWQSLPAFLTFLKQTILLKSEVPASEKCWFDFHALLLDSYYRTPHAMSISHKITSLQFCIQNCAQEVSLNSRRFPFSGGQVSLKFTFEHEMRLWKLPEKLPMSKRLLFVRLQMPPNSLYLPHLLETWKK